MLEVRGETRSAIETTNISTKKTNRIGMNIYFMVVKTNGSSSSECVLIELIVVIIDRCEAIGLATKGGTTTITTTAFVLEGVRTTRGREVDDDNGGAHSNTNMRFNE